MNLSRGPIRRLSLACAAAAAFVLVLGAPNAHAHAFLTGSNPADGAVLDAAPAQLVLHFSESVVLSGMTVSIVDGSGVAVPVGGPSLMEEPPSAVSTAQGPAPEGSAEPTAGATTAEATESPVGVVVDLPHLSRGTYRVSWATVSSDDLHRTAGVLVFGVQTAVTAAGWVESAPAPVESVLRWIVLLALACGIGAPVVRRLVRRAGGAAEADLLLARAVAAMSALGLLASLALVVDQAVASGGESTSWWTPGTRSGRDCGRSASFSWSWPRGRRSEPE